MNLDIKQLESFFEPHQGSILDLWKDPVDFFPCHGSLLWRRGLEALADRPGTVLVEGFDEYAPHASIEAKLELGRKIRDVLIRYHPNIVNQPFGLAVATLTMAVVVNDLPGSTFADTPDPYRPNVRNSWAQVLAPLMAKLRRKIDQEAQPWRAGPLAFLHVAAAVNEFQPQTFDLDSDLPLRGIANLCRFGSSGNSANTERITLPDSRIYGFLDRRLNWDGGLVDAPVAISPKGPVFSLLPKAWKEAPPPIWICFCGSSTSGKTSLIKTLFELNLQRPNQFPGLTFEPAEELKQLIDGAPLVGDAINSIKARGRIAPTNQGLWFADTKGGNFHTARPAGVMTQAALNRNPAQTSVVSGDGVSIDEIITNADLLILTISPQEAASSQQFEKLMARFRECIAKMDRKHAMIALVFTKVDDYGVADPTGIGRIGFVPAYPNASGSFQDAWKVFKNTVRVHRDHSQLVQSLLAMVEKFLAASLYANAARGGKDKWSGPLGVYALSPSPRDPYVSVDDRDNHALAWHTHGVASLFSDFFANYTAPSRMRPLSAGLKALLANAGSAFTTAVQAFKAKPPQTPSAPQSIV